MKKLINIFISSILLVAINSFATDDKTINIASLSQPQQQEIDRMLDKVAEKLQLSDANKVDFKTLILDVATSGQSDEVMLQSLKKFMKIIRSEKEYYMDNWLKLSLFVGLIGNMCSIYSGTFNKDFTFIENIFGISGAKNLVRLSALFSTIVTLYYIAKYYVRSNKNDILETLEKTTAQSIEKLEEEIALDK